MSEWDTDCRCFADGCEGAGEPDQDDLCRECQDHFDGTRCHLHDTDSPGTVPGREEEEESVRRTKQWQS